MDDAQIVWDPDDDPDGNIQHIAENDLTVDEVEDVLLNHDNETLIRRTSRRPITFGWTFPAGTSRSSRKPSATTPR
jgi:hypothetical protein